MAQDIFSSNSSSDQDFQKSITANKSGGFMSRLGFGKYHPNQQNIKASDIQRAAENKAIENIQKENKLKDEEEKKIKNKVKRQSKEFVEEVNNLPEDEFVATNEVIKQEVEEETGINIPEDVAAVTVLEEINAAEENIPDFDAKNFEVKVVSTDKTKGGYYKGKVAYRSSRVPESIRYLSTYVKKQSKGDITPRITTALTISNTNQKFLQGYNLKLNSLTITYRPRFKGYDNEDTARKSTRVMISPSLDDDKKFIIYLQESRNKTIIELSPREFDDINSYYNFVGDRIVEFFTSGYDVTVQKIALRSVNNPLMDVIDQAMSTHEYKARPYADNSGHIYKVTFGTKGDKNTWLLVNVIETGSGKYRLTATRNRDQGFEAKLAISNGQEEYTISDIIKNINNVLRNAYDMNWHKELDLDDVNARLYHLGKQIKYRAMGTAFDVLLSIQQKELQESPINLDEKEVDGLGLEIDDVVTDKELFSKYKLEGEGIQFHTKEATATLMYILLNLEEGDIRDSKSYTTSEEYYQKTKVGTRGKWQERRNVGSREGRNRHYHNGVYVFRLKYKVGRTEHEYTCKTLDELLKNTRILTDDPKFPKTDSSLLKQRNRGR